MLSGGRVIAGAGVGWNETEFANLGAADRFHRRGAYLDEAIRLWRHLWSGSTEPFHGVFHEFTDFVFGPLPIRGDRLPIVVGGSSPAALRRAGGLADGYHATRATPNEMAQRIPVVRAAAEAAGRPAPALSARMSVTTDLAAMLSNVRAFQGLGVEHLALVFSETEPAVLASAIERFDREVVKALDG